MSFRTLQACTAITFVLVASAPQRAAAQEPAQEPSFQISQRGSITQTLGKTEVSLDYSRPLGRKRSDIFGKVVHWGELWTPGANMATTLELSHEVKLNGNVLTPGRWSMWVIPSRVGPWELVLDARDSLFHTERPELSDEQIRFVIDVREDAAHTEALTWSFPRIAQDGATLVMNWLNYEIPLEIEVESIEPSTLVAADEAARYIGVWTLAFEPREEGEAPPPTTLTVRYDDDGRLRATFPPGAFGPPPEAIPEPDYSDMSPQERERAEARHTLAKMQVGGFTYLLVPRAEGIYVMGYEEDGELLEAGGIYHEFEFENGRAVSMTARNDEDRIVARGTRHD
ncbi:hypothetical protein BH23GEM9_BH23GEM9_37600 [soil metagenome]